MFSVQKHSYFSVLSFDLPGGIITPEQLIKLAVPTVPLDQGIVISGRGPVWLFAFLAHHFHPARWVATHDPRLGGAVVVQSHVSDTVVGDVIPLA